MNHPSLQSACPVPFDEGGFLDCEITSDKICIFLAIISLLSTFEQLLATDSLRVAKNSICDHQNSPLDICQRSTQSAFVVFGVG